MSGAEKLPSAYRKGGEQSFTTLVSKLGQFIITNRIELGRLRGIGGYADVYDASMTVANRDAPMKVAVKRFRIILESDPKFAKVVSYRISIDASLICLECSR